MALSAAILTATLEPTPWSAAVERVAAVSPGSSAVVIVPFVALRKLSRVPDPAAPLMMVMFVAGASRSSRRSSQSRVRRGCRCVCRFFLALIVLGRLDDAFWLADRFYPDQRGETQQARELQPGFVIPPAYLSVPAAAPLRAGRCRETSRSRSRRNPGQGKAAGCFIGL